MAGSTALCPRQLPLTSDTGSWGILAERSARGHSRCLWPGLSGVA